MFRLFIKKDFKSKGGRKKKKKVKKEKKKKKNKIMIYVEYIN